MADTIFTSGTVISNSWAIDVNNRTYRDFIDVTSDGYGAKGDGVSDDTTAIQAALNTGRNVYIPYTTSYFKITAALQFKSNNQKVFGIGKPGQIRQLGTSTLNVIESINYNDITLENVHIYGAGGYSNLRTGSGIVVDNGIRATITNCIFENIRGWGVNLYSNSDDAIVSYNKFINAPTTSIVADTSLGGDIQAVYNSKRPIIIGNRNQSNSAVAIKVQSVIDPNNNDNAIIAFNTIINYRVYGITVYRNDKTPPWQSVKGPIIYGNQVENITGELINSITGTYTYGAGIYSQGCEDSEILSNHIRNTHTAAVSFSSTLAPGAIGVTNQSRYNIAHNTIENAGYVGVDVGDNNLYGETKYGAIIADNIITNVTQKGIRVRTQHNLNIHDNTIDTAGSNGIEINLGTTVISNNIKVLSNTISNITGNSILINYASRINISDNIIDTATLIGITIANSSNIKINDNIVYNTTSTGINVSESNSEYISVKDNLIIGNGSTTEGIRFNAVTSNAMNYVVSCVTLFAGTYNPTNYTVASASTIVVPFGVSYVFISGTTNITSITATGHAGREITLIFKNALTFTDGSNLKLAGDFVTTADDTITLICDGTNWYEKSRSAN